MDEFSKKRINKILSDYIEKKVPKHIRNQVKLNYKFRADSVTLIEERMGCSGGKNSRILSDISKKALTSDNITLPQRSLRFLGHLEEVLKVIIQVTHPTG
jgi:3'-phosphoadenosine 5'-phosphosulfate sulfotransferase (PAPS reductase)/FAD synthetase